MLVVQRVGPGCLSESAVRAGSQCFPRRARLIAATDFQNVFKHAEYRASNRWLCVLATASSCDHARLGLAISRKVARNSVQRNRIKRLIRENFRRGKIRTLALDIVVMGRNDVARQTGKAIEAALEKLWIQLFDACAGSSSN